jgi:hypothetical protein
MATSNDAGNSGGDDAPELTRWERLKYTFVQPDDDPDQAKAATDDRTVEELEDEIQTSTDKERAIGLVVAPVAAIVGLVISSASINYAKSHNQSTGVYDKLTYVLLGLAVLILVTSLMRKRMFQGITIALFGLAVFQLKYSYVGFAAPFILVGAWYLVRAYRLQQALKLAQGAGGSGPARPKGSNGKNGARPRPNKRYTPPT